MSWLLLSARKQELQYETNRTEQELLVLNTELRDLSNFSNAIADGIVTPEEMTSLSTSLFEDALQFNYEAGSAAYNVANAQTNTYLNQYNGLSMQDYYSNQSLQQNVPLIYNQQTGMLDGQAMTAQLYEQNLAEYAAEYMGPILNEYEKEITEKRNMLEQQLKAQEAELNSIDQKIDSAIEKSALKL